MIDIMKRNINNDLESMIYISKLFMNDFDNDIPVCPVILNSNESIKVNPDAVPIQCGSKCSICLGEIQERNSVVTQCDHYYCLSCLLKHLELDNKCPLCREEIEEKRPFRFKKILLSDIIKYIEDHFENNNLSDELICIKNFTKNTYQMFCSFLKVHIIQIGQKILEHQYGLNDDEYEDSDESEEDTENEENEEDAENIGQDENIISE